MKRIIQGLFIALLFNLQILHAEREILRWGGDAESGVPQIFYDVKNSSKLTGFEYEVAKAIADYLQLDLKFIQNDYEMLIPGLQRGQYDVVINGMQQNTLINKAQKAHITLSEPYFITTLAATVRTSSRFLRFSDCAHCKIGILKATNHSAKAVNLLPGAQAVVYDDEAKAYDDLKNGRIDCVLLEYPEAFYYSLIDQSVRLLEDKIDQCPYCVVVRDNDPELLRQINEAIQVLKDRGTLQAIYERWGLMNAETAAYFKTVHTSFDKATALKSYTSSLQSKENDDHFYLHALSLFAQAALITLGISFTAMLLALLLGFGIAMIRTYAATPLQTLAAVYIEIVRGIPLLIQLFIIFYGLPNLAPYLPKSFEPFVILNPIIAAIIGLAINYSAYEAEIFRSGFLSIPVGQMEAARALGMTHNQALRYVVFPQTIRTVLPPITNDFIMLMQDSSLISMITIIELTRTYQLLAASRFDYLWLGILAGIFYLLLGLPFTRLSRFFEKKLTRRVQRY